MGVLVLGMLVIALTLIVIVVDVTAVQVARARLYDAADAAALSAANAIAEERLYAQGVTSVLPVDDTKVRARATAYLTQAIRPEHVVSWRLAEGTGAAGGNTARVRLTGTIEIPLAANLAAVVTGPITITVDSQAQARLRRPR